MSWSPRPGYEHRLDALAAQYDGVVSRNTCAAYLTYRDWRRSSSRFYLLGLVLGFWLPKAGIGVVGGLLGLVGLIILVTAFTSVQVHRSAARAALEKEFGRAPGPLMESMRRGPEALRARLNER